jgi:pyruvate/oxaloacetate carboxyltransferase
MHTKPVIFNNTVLRDGHQSLAATRMTTAQMLPVCGLLDSMGFGALETWGGATIDAGLRFLREFPFERLGTLKNAAPKTPHMMLVRGQNIVQYSHFPDDVVEAFILSSAKRGMDIFRIFDALNDTRNLTTTINAVKRAGKHAQGALCYTSSPVHTPDMFIRQGVELAEMGCDSICIKDMAGLIPPRYAYDLVKGLKSKIRIPVVLHTHETAGLGATTYYAAIEAGVDAVDTAIAPFANGTGQPDTVRMLALLDEHPRRPHFDYDQLRLLREHFEKVYTELAAFTSHRNEIVDTDALLYQVPGGMLSNFRNQLKEQKMEDRFDEVFAEIPYVRECLGWIPLVTPTSQIVGVQAMLNVKFGRWKNIAPQAADIALGYYGTTPAPVNGEVRKLAAKAAGKEPIDCRPADLKQPGMAALRESLRKKGMPDDDEHAVIHAMFPAELEKLFVKPISPAITHAAPHPEAKVAVGSGNSQRAHMALTIDGRRHEVTVEEVN